MSTRDREIVVFIYLPGESEAVPAGLFTHNAETGVGRFVYGRRYRDRKEALPVDPIALPLAGRLREVETNGGLYGAFRDASPDYWGRLVVASMRNVPTEVLTEVDYLLAANASRIGNLDFRNTPEDREPGLRPPGFQSLPEIVEAACRVEARLPVADPHVLRLLQQGTSMGGARPKCTVEKDGALWIAKFPAKEDTLSVPRIERATIELARLCGIAVPETRIVSVAGRDVLLVRRFDREKVGGGWARRGFLSALSLMGWDERDRTLWSYPSIAATMRSHAPAADAKELFRRMVFNILVRNTDDHPRNHGFLVDPAGLRLSPAYDLVPTVVQAGVGTEFRLAMEVGERGREATTGNALSQAAKFGVRPKEARILVDELVEIVSGWRALYGRLGVPEREIEALVPAHDRKAADLP